MSILSVHDIQGLSAYQNKIRVPSGHSLQVEGTLKLPLWTDSTRPAGPETGMFGYNTEQEYLEYYNGTEWLAAGSSGAPDGLSAQTAAVSATQLKADYPAYTSGNYYYNIGGTVYQIYTDMETDGGGWMMFGYAGSTTSPGGDSILVPYNVFGSLSTSRSYGQTSFSRFDIAKQIQGAGTNSRMMWRRTDDSNVILIHSVEAAMWNVLGAAATGNWPAYNNTVGEQITYMKMSNTGPNGLVLRTNTSSNPHTCRYEPGGTGGGTNYPGIAWNSPFCNNSDNYGGFTNAINRRGLVYWETNGPQSAQQWFHGSILQMGGSTSPYTSRSRLDVEVYFKV